jgi:uncharacterized pyridoxamine 5'-phosphate oxidase family protein
VALESLRTQKMTPYVLTIENKNIFRQKRNESVNFSSLLKRTRPYLRFRKMPENRNIPELKIPDACN